MPIEVLCPGCKTRFQVSEKFAGKKGPCPKCKTVITVPEKTAEVVVHAPEEFGPKNAAGVGVLKPIARRETRVSLVMVVGILSGIALVLLSALLLRGLERIAPWMVGLSALGLAPPLVWGGYAFLRDDEFEPYRGRSLCIRVLICSLVYAALWGAYAYLPELAFNLQRLEVFHVLVLVPPLLAVGAFAALYTLELEFTDGLVHVALYALVTAILALIAGLHLLGPPPAA